jgi:hypothetical protein
MALDEYVQLLSFNSPIQLFVFACGFALIFYIVFIRRPSFPSNAPKVISSNYPIFGPLGFWTARRDFWRQAIWESKTGNFSFHAGKRCVVGLSSEEGLDLFINSRQLGLKQGYPHLSMCM